MIEDVKIIYEDDDLVVLNKPAGLLVHSANLEAGLPKGSPVVSKEKTLVDWLVERYPEIKSVGDVCPPSVSRRRPGIVHRLDRETSGVLVVAKNQKTFEYLKEQFKKRNIKKTYIALVYGCPKDASGVIDLAIGMNAKDFRKRSAMGKRRGQLREAVTEYKVIKCSSFNNQDFALVEVCPKTGRTHQIRVHLKAIGHSVVADFLYAPKKGENPFGLKRQFLHALSLELNLSAGKAGLPQGEIMKFEADMPEDLQNTLNMLD